MYKIDQQTLKDIDVKEKKSFFEKIVFNFNLACFGRLLDNDPQKVISKKAILIRKAIHPLLLISLPLFAKSKLISPKVKIQEKRPLIFAPTHGFRDDVAHSLALAKKHAYIFFGSLPAFFGSKDGLSSWLNGSLLVNRKNKESKKASKEKSKRAIDLGANLLIYPEGVWNKTPNKSVQKLFPGVYDIARETGALVVPIATILDGKKTYGKIEQPFDITQYSREDGLAVLREKLATAKYEIMLQYCQAKRSDFGNEEENNEYWKKYIEDLIATAKYYDYEYENRAHFIEKGEMSEDEVFSVLDNVPITRHNAVVLSLTRNKKH